jgi:hypothetical protein
MDAPQPLSITHDQFGSIAPQQQWFWQVVQRTLETVFGEKNAASIVSAYRQDVDNKSSGLEQVALYHHSPLSVAADLANWKSEIPDDKLKQFLDIQRQITGSSRFSGA